MENKKLINNILKSANTIAKSSRSGNGNMLIINSQLAKQIEELYTREEELRQKKLLEERNKKIKKLKQIINENYTNNRR